MPSGHPVEVIHPDLPAALAQQPTVANAVTASVPRAGVSVAADTNNALNALGGVFGIAILAAVFVGHGSYATPASFIDGSSRPNESPRQWPPSAS